MRKNGLKFKNLVSAAGGFVHITRRRQNLNGAKLGLLETVGDITKGLARVTFIFRHPTFQQLGQPKRHVEAATSSLWQWQPLLGTRLLIQMIFSATFNFPNFAANYETHIKPRNIDFIPRSSRFVLLSLLLGCLPRSFILFSLLRLH